MSFMGLINMWNDDVHLAAPAEAQERPRYRKRVIRRWALLNAETWTSDGVLLTCEIPDQWGPTTRTPNNPNS